MTASKHYVHLSPAWGGRADTLVLAAVPGTESEFEDLPSRRISDVVFEVCCVPFHLYDVALGDIVEAVSDGDGGWVLTRVVTPSGRYVFRVFFDSHVLVNRDSVVSYIRPLGALWEWGTENLLAISIDDEKAQQLADYLWDRHQRGELVYETGRS